MTSAREAQIADALTDIRESAWRLGPLMRHLHQQVMSDVAAAHHLVPMLERLPGVRTSELARDRGLSTSTVSRQVEQLVQQGWVRTEPDPDDQRAHRLYLTDRAEAHLAAARRDLAALCLRRLGPDRAARLTAAADALADAVDVLADAVGEHPTRTTLGPPDDAPPQPPPDPARSPPLTAV